MVVSHRAAVASGLRLGAVLTILAVAAAAIAAEPKGGEASAKPAKKGRAAEKAESANSQDDSSEKQRGSGGGRHGAHEKVETEVDISGPYTASLDGKTYPAKVDIWGVKATVQIAIDGQDKPMIGMFVKDLLMVAHQYGAANFGLTTGIEAKYDGTNFNGNYARVDAALGPKATGIVLTPTWCGGSGGGGLPVPRSIGDIPGDYAATVVGGGKTVKTKVNFAVDGGTIKITAGPHEYVGDYSGTEMAPIHWEGKRMDQFHLKASGGGFAGTLTKEGEGARQESKVTFTKDGVTGCGGGGDREWTYVYDLIFDNTAPPVWIAKVTFRAHEADVVFNVNDHLLSMKGSLAEGILSATGQEGHGAGSVRLQKNPQGFMGVFREGTATAARDRPVVLRNRPGRAPVVTSATGGL